jgi:hypothetical protein
MVPSFRLRFGALCPRRHDEDVYHFSPERKRCWVAKRAVNADPLWDGDGLRSWSLNASLAAAVGNDSLLMAELRADFMESAERQAD